MDPITAALNAYAATLALAGKFWDGASAEQKVQIVQNWLDTEKRWHDLLDKLKP